MRYGEDDRESDNVEDRRGEGGGGMFRGGGGGGIPFPIGGGGLSITSLLVIGAVPQLEISSMQLLMRKQSIKGWYSGTSIDSQDTVAFSARNGVRSMNEVYPLEKAPEAYERMISGKARFRVVLTMEK